MKKILKYSFIGLAALCTALLCGGYYMLGHALNPDELVTRSRNSQASYEYMFGLEDYRAVCDLFDQEVYHKINLDTCVATRISEGGPCPESVERQIGKVQAFLDKYPL